MLGNLSKENEMSLLYAQSLEIITLYHQPIQKNTFNPSKYYLLPKNWVDEYKNKNNYNNIKQQINDYDYNSLKSKILQDKNNNILQTEQIPQIGNNFVEIKEINLKYPTNFFPVKEEIFKKYLNNKNDILYELIIGENNIFVIDNKSKKNIFICSLNSEQEDIDDFIVNVDYIIMYDMEKTFKNEMKKYISDNKGFRQYCKKRKLVSKINEKQDIIDNEGDKIGIFFTINDSNYDTPDEILDARV